MSPAETRCWTCAATPDVVGAIAVAVTAAVVEGMVAVVGRVDRCCCGGKAPAKFTAPPICAACACLPATTAVTAVEDGVALAAATVAAVTLAAEVVELDDGELDLFAIFLGC